MKKAFYILTLFAALLVGCGTTKTVSEYTYFTKETVNPQLLVDSLLGDYTSPYGTWMKLQVYGVHEDSTLITQYLNLVDINDTLTRTVTVVKFNNSDTAVVKGKDYNPKRSINKKY